MGKGRGEACGRINGSYQLLGYATPLALPAFKLFVVLFFLTHFLIEIFIGFINRVRQIFNSVKVDHRW